ncbi:LADA_0D13432g1_1 [Lachancea dasiensis]|uniref:LADA_0D13432g1_1 n=1 Tax=Lachancea dasiensis TaxID=1072105 RepID=A0A1G4J8R7_9SACH|nr:LADA_0D13432g1_1 [Lachancea dasiensis]
MERKSRIHFLSLTLWFLLLDVVFAVVAILALRKRRQAFLKAYEEVAKPISAQRPGTDLHMWDSIALELNSTFAKDESWHSAVCLWDGADCDECFRSLIYLPFKRDDLSDVVAKNVKNSILVYEDSIKEQWSCNVESKTSYDAARTEILPKDVYRSKLTWRMANIMKKVGHWSYALYFVVALCLYSVSFWTLYIYAFLMVGVIIGSAIPSRTNLLDIHVTLQFLEIVANQKPGEGSATWDTIAKAMNNNVQSCVISPFFKAGFFFDEHDCRQIFGTTVTTILSCKKSNFPELAPLANWCKAVS